MKIFMQLKLKSDKVYKLLIFDAFSFKFHQTESLLFDYKILYLYIFYKFKAMLPLRILNLF